MSAADIDVAMQRWELTEALLRKEDPKYELAQEKAEMAIHLGNDYESADHRQKP